MSNTLKYKGYDGSVEFSAEDRVFHGSVLGIKDRVTFEGEGVADLETNFQSAVDEYLQICSDAGKEPEKPFKGTFNVRVTTSLHKQAVLRAREDKVSLNKVVADALEGYLIEM